ncbi:MAG TPA: C45 family peptidase [Streptosporangiaceae bacterium]|jgi:isopenicillin-N N-acyltransferase-like protein
MIRHYRSAPASPGDRGHDFGAAHPAAVAATADKYARLFAAVAGRPVDMLAAGREALAAIRRFSVPYASEIEGIAAGAGLAAETVAALNARTEILARLVAPRPSECSTAVLLGEPGGTPVALQTWDWHDEFAGSWLIWTVEHPGGHVVHTLTEYGILGKIGVSSAGLGLNLNILHHGDDGGRLEVPVHVLARAVLDAPGGVGEALATIGAAGVSASSALTVTSATGGEPVALTAEVFPGGPRFVLPGPDGVLVHTNHFLDPHAAQHERANQLGPNSYLRYAVLRRRLAGRAGDGCADVLAAMHTHAGGSGAICCHPDPAATLGSRYATLATVSLDVTRGAMSVLTGGPCSPGGGTAWWTTPGGARG